MQIEFPYRTRKKPDRTIRNTKRIESVPMEAFARFSPATRSDVLGALDARLSAAI